MNLVCRLLLEKNFFFFFFFNDTATTEIYTPGYTLSLHDALPIYHFRVRLLETVDSDGIVPVSMPLSILYEDEDILVINKPADMPVHPSIGNYENTLANAVAWYFQQQNIPFVFRCINRLDRDTTGLLILAKNMLSGAILSDQMKKREIHRIYLAITEGKTDPAGTINRPIGRADQSLILRQVDPDKGDPACTHYLQKCWHPKTFYPATLSVPQDGLSLVQLQLETGRTHQIRVHMTSIGHPLIGDTLYNPETALLARQALHSYRLAFTHPVTGVPLEFTSSLPADMAEFFPEYHA